MVVESFFVVLLSVIAGFAQVSVNNTLAKISKMILSAELDKKSSDEKVINRFVINSSE